MSSHLRNKISYQYLQKLWQLNTKSLILCNYVELRFLTGSDACTHMLTKYEKKLGSYFHLVSFSMQKGKKSRDLSSLSSSVTLFSYILYCTFYLKVDLTKINVRSHFLLSMFSSHFLNYIIYSNVEISAKSRTNKR